MSAEPAAETTDHPETGVNPDRRVGEGRDVAWALQHTEALRRVVRRRVQPLDCCEEVLQEVWIAAAHAERVPEEPEEQLPWLVTVAIRQAAMALRSWGRRQRREAVYAEQREVDPVAHDPAFALLADERRTLLREQMERLPEQLRMLLQMKYVWGLTYREIGKRTGMELTAVEYQLTKARQQLRRRLVEAGIEGDRGDE